MKTLNTISRYIVGIVFIFSGFVKGIDPLGSTYKFVDYFNAFGMSFLEPIAFPLAVLLCTIEFTLGVSLIFSAKQRIVSWVVLLFMSFFTVLTFILAIFNPVTDCGCFGDAIKMTNWQTFWKNIFIMFFTLLIFFNRNKFLSKWNVFKQWSVVVIAGGFLVFISIFSYNHLPMIDFLPYSVGTYIPEKMIIPEGAPLPEYETMLIYEKDGKTIEVTIDNLPDSTWNWVETKNSLIKEGYIPPIHDFIIQSLDGEDYTDLFLNDNKFTFLVVAYDLSKTKIKNFERINHLQEFCQTSGQCNVICLTSSLQSEIESFAQKTNAGYMFFNTDETTLKTMIRANPGLILLRRGLIIKKWNVNDLPNPDYLEEQIFNNEKYRPKVRNTDNNDFNV